MCMDAVSLRNTAQVPHCSAVSNKILTWDSIANHASIILYPYHVHVPINNKIILFIIASQRLISEIYSLWMTLWNSSHGFPDSMETMEP